MYIIGLWKKCLQKRRWIQLAKQSTVSNVDPGNDLVASWGDEVKLSIEEVFTDKTRYSESDGATVTFNLNNGSLQAVTLEGNRTLALDNVAVGRAFIVSLKQDGSGGRTVNWWSTIKWPDNVVPTLTTTINKTDTFGFICTSSGNYLGFIVGQNL